MKRGRWFLAGVVFGVIGTLLSIAFRQYKKRVKSATTEEILGI
jgi:predicted membrane protein